jgi:hypothetical protein
VNATLPSTVELALPLPSAAFPFPVKIEKNSHGDLVRRSLGRALTIDQSLPRLITLMHNLDRVLLSLGLAVKRKHVLGLSIGDFVDSEPFLRCSKVTGQVPLDIFDIVESGCEGIIDVHDDDFPVGFSLVEEGHDAEDLDLLDFSDLCDSFTDFTDVEGVVVAVCLGLRVGDRGVFPRLGEGTVVPDLQRASASVRIKGRTELT